MNPGAATPLALALAELEQLDALRADHERGDGRCPLLEALRLCLARDVSLPDWLKGGLLGAIEQLRMARAKTLDEVLGSYWPEGTRIEDERRRLELERRIPEAVWELYSAAPARPINRDFFEEVGERSGIHLSGSTVEKHYYRMVSEGRAINVIALHAAAGPLNTHETSMSRGLELMPPVVQSEQQFATDQEKTT